MTLDKINKDIVVKMMNEASKWAKAKGDVYDTGILSGGIQSPLRGRLF